MCEIARNYFHNRFSAQQGDYSHVISVVHCRVTEEDNVDLLKPFSIEEFRIATFQMHPDKALGPDGLNPAFCQKF